MRTDSGEGITTKTIYMIFIYKAISDFKSIKNKDAYE